MPTHTLTFGWTRNGETISNNVNYAVEGEQNVDLDATTTPVAAGATAKEVTITIDVSKLATIIIQSDQDITIKTNSTGTPDDTLTVKANKPLVWGADSGLPNPFPSGVDVTKIYIANPAASVANVKIRTGYDTTP